MKTLEQKAALQEAYERIAGRAYMNRKTAEIAAAFGDEASAARAWARVESYETALSDIEFVMNN